MTPNTFRKRLDVLRQRAVDAQPPPPALIVMRSLPGSARTEGGRIPELLDGETSEQARVRLGYPEGTTLIVIEEVDASTPRPPEATP